MNISWPLLISGTKRFGLSLALSSFFVVEGAGSSTPYSAPLTSTPSTSTTTIPTPPKKSPPPPPHRGKLIIPDKKKEVITPQGAPSVLFSFPGVVQYKDAEWIGADNFVNMSKAISMKVDIVKPPALKLTATPEGLQKKAGALLSKAGFTKKEEDLSGKPPLPFLHFTILVYPVEGGYAGVVNASLLEDVKLDRVQLDKDYTFQAITWEQSKLMVSPFDSFEADLVDALESITSDFIKRVAAYQHPRQEEKPSSTP
jgi:hypothetical protein